MKVQLICEEITKELDGFTLSHIDFTAEPGEITGIIGVNGSGKTTLIRTLLGAYRLWESDSGRIRMECMNRSGDVFTAELDGADGSKRYKDKIAYVLTQTPYPINMICIEVGEVYGKYYSAFDLELYREKLSDFSLKEKQRIGALSTGERMRQQIAFALASGADVYLFDEPAGNLDVDFREKFNDLLRQLAYDENKVVLYATHIVEELECMADRILWLDKESGEKDNKGIQKFFGTIDELRDSYRIVEAPARELEQIPEEMIVGKRTTDLHSEALVNVGAGEIPDGLSADIRLAGLQEIMYYSCSELKKRSGSYD